MTKVEKDNMLLTLYNILGEVVSDSKLSKNLFVGKHFDLFCENEVMKIMEAMKKKRKIRLEKYVFFEIDPKDEYQVVTVAPYQLHYIHKSWYVMGLTDEYGLMRIPLLFHWHDAIITDEPYEYPADYSPEEYNKMLYGTTCERLNLVVEIKGCFTDSMDFKEYPLMPFQQKIENGYWDERKRFTYLNKSTVRVHFDMPMTPFALYTLKTILEKYFYKIISDKDPFALFTHSQYSGALYNPVVL